MFLGGLKKEYRNTYFCAFFVFVLLNSLFFRYYVSFFVCLCRYGVVFYGESGLGNERESSVDAIVAAGRCPISRSAISIFLGLFFAFRLVFGVLSAIWSLDHGFGFKVS